MADTQQMNSQETAKELENQKTNNGFQTMEETAPMKADDEKCTAVNDNISSTEIFITELRQLVEHPEKATKDEINRIKQSFYKIINNRKAEELQQFIEQGGKEVDFVPKEEKEEAIFKQLMQAIKEKRKILAEKDEQEKELNLQTKLTIIDELKELVESTEDAGKKYKEFKMLQKQWNETKNIPVAKINELWESYKVQMDRFYDQIELNQQFREYDFKKNLEAKTKLCEAAEKLSAESDVVSAFHQLQKLHQEYREIGPVSKELRADIWSRFKTASSVVNKRYQQHFEQIKRQEEENLDNKTAICEIIEEIDYDSLTNFALWDEKTQEIIALQNKWKTIGFAPQKSNVKIFERFRKDCDEFFAKKTAFFKKQKAQMNENLALKKALCEKAEALKESTAWKETSDILIKLQKEWKQIGPVGKKYSDAIWNRFIAACDHFFEQKNKANNSQKVVEEENLKKKLNILEQLDQIGSIKEEDEEKMSQRIQTLMQQWNEIGFVPFKEKDNIYQKYKNKIDHLFEQFNINKNNRKIDHFKSSIKAMEEYSTDALFKERDKISRIVENIKSELSTYENNLGFMNASSKKGNSLIDSISKKIEKLKQDLQTQKEKLKILEDTLRKKEQ